MTDQLLDTNRLAYSWAAPSPQRQAATVRRWGWLAYAEYTWAGMRAYLQTILIATVGLPLLYLTAMGIGLGALVDKGAGLVGGVPYLVFVGPGLLVSAIVMEGMGEFSYPVMGGFKWQRFYYAAQASPMTPRQIVSGQVFAVATRFFLQATVFWIALVLFGVTRSGWSFLIVPIATLAAVSFGTPMMAYAATLENEGFQFAFVQRFIVNPMFLFAGTFYPLESMPVSLQWVGWISPMWHGTQLARIVTYGMPNPLWLTVVHVVFLVATAAAGLLAAFRIFARRLTR